MHLRSLPIALMLILGAAARPALAQKEARPLPRAEAVALYEQIGDHMEATAMVAPELARAGIAEYPKRC